jgi:hypothetical protein
VQAEYTYEFGGRSYTGRRVNGVWRRVGQRDFRRKQYEALLEHKQAGRPFPARVNPDHPSQSILFPDPPALSPYALAAAGGLAGLGLLPSVYCVWVVVVAVRRRRMIRRHGEKWWLMRRDWRRMRVTPCAVLPELCAAAALLGCGVVLLPVLIVGVPRLSFIWWILALPLAACVAAVLCLGAGIAARRALCGVPVLSLATVPVVPGAQVDGSIRVARRLAPDTVRLKLVCVRTTLGGRTDPARKGRRYHELAFEQLVQPAAPPQVGPGRETAVPVTIDIPAGQPETAVADSVSVSWHLQMEARFRRWGLPFDVDLQLPVYCADGDDLMHADARLPADRRPG